MSIPDTDEGWKKKLSPEAYRALRLGEPEEPHTGAYTNTQVPGIYVCAGCDTPLFSSEQKSDTGSGHATFMLPPNGGPVALARTYSPEGEERTAAKCRQCGGVLGYVADMALRSADDLMDGKKQQFLLASSHSIKLRKSLSPVSYPIPSIIALVLLFGAGVGLWQWSASIQSIGTHEDRQRTVQMWVGDLELHVTMVLGHELIDNREPILEVEPLLIVLARTPPSPILIHTRPVDVMWLDALFTVVEVEQGVLMDGSSVWNKPPNANFALIVRPGTIPEPALTLGTTLIIPNRAQLLQNL